MAKPQSLTPPASKAEVAILAFAALAVALLALVSTGVIEVEQHSHSVASEPRH